MTARFPDYDVLSKRDGMSWNEQTRQVIDERLAVSDEPVFFKLKAYRILKAVSDRILPQGEPGERVPIAAYIDRNMRDHGSTGTRYEPMPYDGEAWNIGLAALEAEAQGRYGVGFCDLGPDDADALLTSCQKGELCDTAWAGIPSKMFFERRILVDIPAVFYAHPKAWNEIGFGGPASPRGYVRMQANRRDPWEAAEEHIGKPGQAARANARIR